MLKQVPITLGRDLLFIGYRKEIQLFRFITGPMIQHMKIALAVQGFELLHLIAQHAVAIGQNINPTGRFTEQGSESRIDICDNAISVHSGHCNRGLCNALARPPWNNGFETPNQLPGRSAQIKRKALTADGHTILCPTFRDSPAHQTFQFWREIPISFWQHAIDGTGLNGKPLLFCRAVHLCHPAVQPADHHAIVTIFIGLRQYC